MRGSAKGSAIAIVLSVGIAETALAEEFECRDPLLAVEAASESVANRVCEAALDAKSHLSDCGLSQSRRVTIELRASIEGVAEHCAGVYYPGTNRILVIAPTAVKTVMPPDSAFAKLDADTFFNSLIVHELAHALMEQTMTVSARCTADKEYVAYALQIESLPERDRELVLAHRQIDLPVKQERLNDFVLGFRPDTFALLAWSHFSAAGNGCDFVGDMLDGGVSFALPDVE